jgi:SAM-dependent methyltransferase
MPMFREYAHYYDLLYGDKNYAAEARFVCDLLRHHVPGARQILDLGCGTGAHAALMTAQGYSVHGIDISPGMIEKGQRRHAELPIHQASRLCFSLGDIRTVRLHKRFDAIVSLFHAINYQITNEDLQAALTTVRAHLKPGGVFIFDCWYGPAVLSDRPSKRDKRAEDSSVSVLRLAEPTLYPNENLVDVHYRFSVRDRINGRATELEETHRMRYLFKPELDLLLGSSGLTPLLYREWMTDREPGFDTWAIYAVARG